MRKRVRGDGVDPLDRGDVVRIGLARAAALREVFNLLRRDGELVLLQAPQQGGRALAVHAFLPSVGRHGHVARRRLACVFMATPRRRLGAAIDLRSRLRRSLRGS